VQNSHYVQLSCSPILAALLLSTPATGISETLRHGTRNGIMELSQRAPPIFGWAAITLGIGPHSNLFLLSFFSSPNLSGRSGCLPYFYTWCGLSANLECRSEMCCTQLAGNTGRKNDAKNRYLGTISKFCRAESSQLRHISTIGKKLVKQQYLLHISNFGPLAAEIGSGVWGTPTNFDDFHVLAVLLHATLVVGVSQTLQR